MGSFVNHNTTERVPHGPKCYRGTFDFVFVPQNTLGFVRSVTENVLQKFQRHRLVNKCLAEELETDIHALRIQAIDPKEFDGQKQAPPPRCGGGAGL